MTVKEIAQQTGLTNQAVYKRLKAAGLSVAKLKDSKTGHFTEHGEQIIRELFNLDVNQVVNRVVNQTSPDDNQVDSVKELTTKVEELTKERNELINRVESMQKRVEELIEERDFLRMTLERSQHLEAAAIAKLPSPPKLLTEGEEKPRGLRGLFQKMRGGHRGE